MISKDFVLAGCAIFTVEVPEGAIGASHPHYTYKVDRVEASDRWPESYFIRFLSGPDNTSDYTYLGKLDPVSGKVILTRKSAFPANAYRVKLLSRVLARIWANEGEAIEAAGFKVHHCGYCGCCGRDLTTPISLERGIGPVCWEKLHAASAPF